MVHQWHNFGEDVYRALQDECEVFIDEIDSSTSEFHLRGIHKRELRATASKVREIAEKHLMSHIIDVSELTNEASD